MVDTNWMANPKAYRDGSSTLDTEVYISAL